MSRKMRKLWTKKKFIKDKPFKRFNKENFKEFASTDKSPIVCYECKKYGHIKAECPQLKTFPPKKFFKRKKKGMIAT